jgi:hypothetical protein
MFEFCIKNSEICRKKLIKLTDNFVSFEISLTTKIIVYTRNYVYYFTIFIYKSCSNYGFLENYGLELVSLIRK